jgi:uncharacterized protein DUF4112
VRFFDCSTRELERHHRAICIQNSYSLLLKTLTVATLNQHDRRPGAQPEILPPEPSLSARSSRANRALSDENLDLLSHLLDDWFRIPGTNIRFGLDGIIGLIPGFGDIAGGLASCILIVAAWVRGVPYITLTRMMVNLALDVIIGAVPLLGDVFDVAWKANRRNYALLIRHVREPRQHTWRDWMFLLSLSLVALSIFLVPVALLFWIAARTLPPR